ncbi:substrate-binding periplasmic protein [Motiliproteus sp.]|uniref:substrate-binding periplasmic protein n=1 Tax=Motiliproteus sp. TaxID=1898955 RepID=UPI003BABD891
MASVFRSVVSIVVILLSLSVQAQAEGDSTASVLLALKQDSQPKYFLNALQRQGLCDRIYAELSQRLAQRHIELQVQQPFVPIKRLLKQIEHGAADLFCGAGRNAEREARFHYLSTPVYEVSNVVLAHRDEPLTPQTFADLAAIDHAVAIIDGTSSGRFLQRQGVEPGALFNEINRAIKAVADNPRVRFFYYHDLGLNYALISHKNLPIRVVPSRFRTVPQWILVSRQTPDSLRQALETTLAEMQADGTLAAIGAEFLALKP